ncbi:bifunctional DNA primase/polymerase [Laspinema sp. D1]|uniref:Bifunctional DNA primase/polymerase n=1 Tax=Laspinema palackyanum D2a TaxID=2953684 RepID=A0ABT2MKA4_9CYAN|nr:bifunctional DNA primase/polymerase [Laspinema sp. D2a]
MLADFSYCKIKPGTKQPQGLNWQKLPLTWEEVAGETACGILSGHGGFLAVDCDGEGAIARLTELFGGSIPQTWAWSSGKPGRIQFGFVVPQELRDRFQKARYWEDLPDGSQLDFRWKGCQSVLPPSPHPETGAYHWVNSPDDCAIAIAPEWLIDYAIALKNRKLESVRLPARLYSVYRAPLKIWAFAQLAAKGSGRAEFSLEFAAGELQRSVSSIRRLLTQAMRLGLIRHFYTEGDRAIVYPYALKKIAKAAGLETLAEIAEIKYEDIKNLNIKCTEAIAAGLQRASLFAAKESQRDIPEENRIKPINPLVNHAALGQRVLWLGPRFIGVSEKFVLWGASQSVIASHRGVSERTIQRHLSNTYRNQPSEVRGSRSDLEPINKAQICQRLPRRMNFLGNPAFSEILIDDLDGKILACGDRVYRCHTNLYQFDAIVSLAGYKWRRAAYKSFLAA